jgi:hypothetical protein
MKYGELNLGQVEAIVNRLGGMDGVQRFLSGESMVKMVEHVIDCDADPFVPSGWKVESHTKGGQFVFNPAKIKLYLSPNQQNGKSIDGNKLRKELANEPVFNANVLDYLLAHPELIPEEWKKDERGNTRYIFFWGTIYRVSSGHLCVRCLYFHVGSWRWYFIWLDDDWDDDFPAALRAS